MWGVPQVSVLGPLLYIIFANDLNNLIKRVDTVTYADDIALCINGGSPSELTATLNAELQLVYLAFSLSHVIYTIVIGVKVN